MRKTIASNVIALTSLVAVALPLRAETLPIEGIYPADNDTLSALNSLAIRSFTGSEGQSLEIQLEQRLRDAVVRGAPYFSIVGFRGNGSADGVLSGSAYGRSEARNEVVRRQICASRNDKGKCVETQVVNENCTRRNITLNYNLSVEGRRQERIFSVSNTAVDSTLICSDTTGVPPVDVVLQYLIANVATGLRIQFAPLERHEDIRVKEGTEGLEGNAKKKFKEGIKLTKRNTASACEAWGEVDQLVPNHAPTLFNLGLCAESRGDYNGAEALYRRVQNIDRSQSYAAEAIQRLELRRRAERQLAVHASRRRS